MRATRSLAVTAKRLRNKAQGCRALAATLGTIAAGSQPQRGFAINDNAPTKYEKSEIAATSSRYESNGRFPRVAVKARQPWALLRTASR